jgi:hypothetical protein
MLLFCQRAENIAAGEKFCDPASWEVRPLFQLQSWRMQNRRKCFLGAFTVALPTHAQNLVG